jgi:hypothetical protein
LQKVVHADRHLAFDTKSLLRRSCYQSDTHGYAIESGNSFLCGKIGCVSCFRQSAATD